MMMMMIMMMMMVMMMMMMIMMMMLVIMCVSLLEMRIMKSKCRNVDSYLKTFCKIWIPFHNYRPSNQNSSFCQPKGNY